MRKPLARIEYDLQFEMQMARLAMGVSTGEWEAMHGTPIWSPDGALTKSDIIILYRLQNRTEAVSSDIHAREIERKARKNGKR
jgi:hypothetical protein